MHLCTTHITVQTMIYLPYRHKSLRGGSKNLLSMIDPHV